MRNNVFYTPILQMGFWLLLLVGIQFSCNPLKICPSPPEFDYTVPAPLPPSTIGSSLSMNIEALEGIIDKKFPKLIKSPGSGDVKYAIHRKEPVRLSISPNLDVRLNSSVRYRGAFPAPITPRCGYVACDAQCVLRPSLKIDFLSSLSLQRDYTFDFENPRISLMVDKTCEIGIATANIDISPLLKYVGESEINKILYGELNKINKNIKSEYYTKLEEGWNLLNKPFFLNENISLLLNPREIKVSNPTFTSFNSSINTNLGFIFYPEVFIGNPLNFEPQMSPIPLATITNNIPKNQFELNIPAFIDLRFIENQLTSALQDEFSQDIPIAGRNVSITVNDVQFKAYGDKIVVRVNYEAGRLLGSGWLYFFGTPSYNRITKILSFPDLDYSVETSNFIPDIIDIAARQVILDRIRNATTINLSKVEQNLRQHFQEIINQEIDGFSFEGEVLSFDFIDIRTSVENNSILVFFRTTGVWNLGIPSLKYPDEKEIIKNIQVHFDVFEENKDFECGFTVYIRKDGKRCKAAHRWGAGKTWKDFDQLIFNSDCFEGESNIGNYTIELHVTDSDDSPCSGLDVEGEIYSLIETRDGSSDLSPLRFERLDEATSNSKFELIGNTIASHRSMYHTNDLTAQTTSINSSGNPFGYTNFGFQEQHVVFKGDDGHIYELVWNNEGWYRNNLTAPLNATLAASDPTAYTFGNSEEQHIIYRGIDSHIYELYFNQTGWHKSDLTKATNSVLPIGNLAAYSFNHFGEQHIVYRGTENNIHELWWDGSKWNYQNLTNATNAVISVGDPDGYVFGTDNSQHIVYKGIDDHIHELWWRNDAGWNHGDLTSQTTAPLAASDPTGYAFDAFGEQHVIFRGVNNHICELWWNGTVWQSGDLTTVTNAPIAGGKPKAYIGAGNTQHIVYRSGNNNNIIDLWWNNRDGWQFSNLTSLTNAPLVSGDPKGFMGIGNTQHVVYRGTDNSIHDLWWRSGAQWRHTDLSKHTFTTNAQSNVDGFVLKSHNSHHIIFRGSNNEIHELSWNGTGWHSSKNLTVQANAPFAVGDPKGYAFDNFEEKHIIFRSVDNHIHELVSHASGWTHRDLTLLTNATLAIGDPDGYVFNTDNSQHVIYRGTDGHIHELWWRQNAGWNHGDLTSQTNAPNAASDPAGYSFDAFREQHVIFRGTDNHIHELLWDGARWRHGDLTAATNAPLATGTPDGYIGKSNIGPDVQHIVFKGADNHIHELWWDQSGWHHNDLTQEAQGPLAGSDPEGIFDFDSFSQIFLQTVVYKGQDNHIHLLDWSNTHGWKRGDLTTWAEAPLAKGKPSIYIFEGFPRSRHVIYRGMDDKVDFLRKC